MRRHSTPTDPSDSQTFSRRGFLGALAATGLGAAALSASSGTARADHSVGARNSYTVLEGTPNEQQVHVYTAAEPGPTTFVTGGVHGDEQAGFLAADQIAEWGVSKGKLVVMPRCHPEAIEGDYRPWGEHDLNRQFPPKGGDCMSELARAVWTEVERHDPDWVFDLHSSRGIYKSGDGGVGQALFPTWTSPARKNGENTVNALNEEFGLSGDMAYRMGNTLDADRDMMVHRVAGVLDRPGYICETTEKAPLDDQVAWHLFTVEHVMAQYGQERTSGIAAGPAPGPAAEARTLSLDDPWGKYALEGSYENPAVFAPALSYQGPQPAHTRVRNVSAAGFEAKVEEWLYQNGIHYPEETGMLAVESGVHDLGGSPLEVGTCSVNHEFGSVGFEADFASTPVVLAQPQTVAGLDPIVPRLQDVSASGMDVCVQEEDGEPNGGYHYVEEVAYLALEAGRGSLGGRAFEAGTCTSDHEWTHIDFEGDYDNPVFLATTQTFAGWNTVTVRYTNLTSSGVDVMLQEEQSDDEEMTHVDETVGYLVIEG